MRLRILTSKDTKVRSNTGIYIVEELIRRNGLRDFLIGLFPERATQATYDDADVVLGLTYGILSGASHLEDLNEVKRELECDYLKVPSSDTIAYRCNQLSVEDFKVSNDDSQVLHYFNYNSTLNSILANLGARLNPDWRRKPVMIDYDNTITFTGKDSRPTYKQGSGYQPGVGIIDNQPVYIEGRNGNSNSPYHMEDTLARMVGQLEAAGIKVGGLRIDAAAYSKKVFHWLSTRPDIKYYIGSRKQDIDILNNSRWEKHESTTMDFEVTSLPYQTPGEQDCKLVVYRTKTSGQADLFWKGYNYRFILTNDWEMTDSELVIHYNKRGGSERVFEYMKYDFNWNNLPFAHMRSNTTYLLLTSMCYLIYRWVLKKVKHFEGVTEKIRVKKFTLYFINTPGKWIQSGRQKILKLYTCKQYDRIINTT